MTKLEREARKYDNILRVIVGNIHVGQPDQHVRDVVESKMTSHGPQELIDAVLDRAVEIHHENRDEYAWVMGGCR